MKQDKVLEKQLYLFDDTQEYLPSINTLKDGVYDGLHYKWILELESGEKFHMPFGIERERDCAVLTKFSIKKGNLQPINN